MLSYFLSAEVEWIIINRQGEAGEAKEGEVVEIVLEVTGCGGLEKSGEGNLSEDRSH